MTDIVAQIAGIDISKSMLEVHLHPQAAARQFANTAVGIAALVSWLRRHRLQRVVFEATGAYHRLLEHELARAGVPMLKVNPLQARRFAEAIGRRAKTDPVDAAMLARFGALDELQARPMVSQTLRDRKELRGAAWSRIVSLRQTASRFGATRC